MGVHDRSETPVGGSPLPGEQDGIRPPVLGVAVTLDVAHLGVAGHHAPEDRPHEIAAAIVDWLGRRGLVGH